MASEAPPFWWEEPDWRAYALYPVSRIYSFVATRRMINARREKPVVTTVPSIARGQSAARVRLVVTAGAFAALWIALVWWRLLP